MSPMPSYDKRFRQRSDAASYDESVYRRGSVSDLLWQAEKSVLERLAASLRPAERSIRYLDFACGTGRILSFFAPFASSTLGVDISFAMLARAHRRVPEARLACWDISRGDEVLAGGFDLITSFRFITNAEPELTRTVLRALRKHLSPDGRLIVNIHANPLSYRGVMIPYYWLKERLTGTKMLQHLTRRQTAREIRAAGFEILEVVGLGFVPAKLLPLIPFRLALGLERRLAGLPGLQRFGVNQIFVCRRQE